MQTCAYGGCQEQAKSKGFCLRHYKRFWRTGSPEEAGARHESPERRFWKYVTKTDSCWIWAGMKDKDGYGVLTMKRASDGKHAPHRAHRLSLEIHGRPVPDGLFALHRCHNPSCVNPDHLYAGDHLQNMKDKTDADRCHYGSEHANAKITEVEARAIILHPGPAAKAGALYGISASQARNIRSGRQWRHVYEAVRLQNTGQTTD